MKATSMAYWNCFELPFLGGSDVERVGGSGEGGAGVFMTSWSEAELISFFFSDISSPPLSY